MANFTKDQYDALMLHVENDASFDEFVHQLMRVYNQNNVSMNDCIEYMESHHSFEEVDAETLYNYLMTCEKYKRIGSGIPVIVFNAVHLVNYIDRNDLVEKWQRYLSHSKKARIFWALYDTKVLDLVKQQPIVN